MSDAERGRSPGEATPSEMPADEAPSTTADADPLGVAARRLETLAVQQDPARVPESAPPTDLEDLRATERALLAALGRVRKLKRGRHGR